MEISLKLSCLPYRCREAAVEIHACCQCGKMNLKRWWWNILHRSTFLEGSIEVRISRHRKLTIAHTCCYILASQTSKSAAGWSQTAAVVFFASGSLVLGQEVAFESLVLQDNHRILWYRPTSEQARTISNFRRVFQVEFQVQFPIKIQALSYTSRKLQSLTCFKKVSYQSCKLHTVNMLTCSYVR